MTEANISTSLANAINEHCRQFEASDEFSEMVAAHVRKLYDDAIKDVFRWGKFPDAVKDALKEALPANITDVCDHESKDSVGSRRRYPVSKAAAGE